MKEKNDHMRQLFDRIEDEWDVAEPAFGHEERFAGRLQKQNTKSRKWIWPVSIAASLVLLLGITLTQINREPQQTKGIMSSNSRQADSVFKSNISFGKELLLERKNSRNKQLVNDALVQLQQMEKDYARLREELKKNGESKQLMHALVKNLKTQIEFLEKVTNQLDASENHQINHHEQTL